MTQANGLHDFAERSRAKAQSPELAALQEENARLREQQAKSSREVNDLRSELQAATLQMMSARREAEKPAPPLVRFEVPKAELQLPPDLLGAVEAILAGLTAGMADALSKVQIIVQVNPTPIAFAPTFAPHVAAGPVELRHEATYTIPPNPPSEITLKMPAREKRRLKVKYRKAKDGEEYPDEIEES